MNDQKEVTKCQDMRCEKCNKKLAVIQIKCPKCGTVNEKQIGG